MVTNLAQAGQLVILLVLYNYNGNCEEGSDLHAAVIMRPCVSGQDTERSCGGGSLEQQSCGLPRNRNRVLLKWISREKKGGGALLAPAGSLSLIQSSLAWLSYIASDNDDRS